MASRPSTDFIDAYANQNDLLSVLSWKVELVPKDLQAEVKRVRLEREHEGCSAIPNFEELTEKSQSLAEELESMNNDLADLQKIIQVQKSDKDGEIITMSQMRTTVLRELRQLMDGFTRCYQSNIGVWCVKKPPHLSQLGPTLKRVHSELDKFSSLFEDMNSTKELHTKISHNKNGGDLKQKLLAHPYKSTSDIFQSSLSILEESIHREESNFTSRFPNLITL